MNFKGHRVDRYLLTSVLGWGSSGTVYSAVDTKSNHSAQFAIKCIPMANLPRRLGIQLVMEITYQDALRGCPHVLALHDILQEGPYIFLVLELCETDMFKSLKKGVYLGNDDLIRKAFLEVLDGISACHQRRVFHRDLKPENIMCKADGTGIRIGDFGMATHHRVSRDGETGSGPYMSPGQSIVVDAHVNRTDRLRESWDGEDGYPYYSAPTDVWALGVTLFVLVTSYYPWKAALPTDEGFMAFLEDEDRLFHKFPISRKLNVLLKGIFHPYPKKRLSIPMIRQEILEMDTFYRWRQSRPSAPPVSKKATFSDS